MYLTIEEWNRRQPLELSLETVRKHARAGHIYPAPQKYGRRWIFDENAKLMTSVTATSLMERIKRDGTEKKKRKS